MQYVFEGVNCGYTKFHLRGCVPSTFGGRYSHYCSVFLFLSLSLSLYLKVKDPNRELTPNQIAPRLDYMLYTCLVFP